MIKRLVRFETSAGETLKGVVIEPAPHAPRNDVAIVYMPGTVLGTTSVHGLAFKVGGNLATAGFSTVVIDPPGVGESEGDFPAGTNEEISDWVAEGNLAPSGIEIIDWVRSQLGFGRVALIGHCGGALTAAYVAAQHDSVIGALLISPPPLRREKGSRAIDRPEVANEYFKQYRRKAFDPRQWRRLMTGETNYRTLMSVLSSKVRSRMGRPKGGTATTLDVEGARFNGRLVEAGKQCLASGKQLAVVFGDKDLDMPNFQTFHRLHLGERVPLVIINDTSHGFTTANGQLRLNEEALHFAMRLMS